MVEERTEQTEQPIDQSKPKSNKKPFIIAGIVAFGVVFIIVAIVLCLCLKTPPKEEPAPSVDFSQKVTNMDGTEFKPTYDAGSDEDLSVRFTDLECNEDCSNISNLKIGNKILKAGEDYEVKRGSVIIVIYKKILQAIQNGQYDITFEIKSGEKTISVGLKITIANSSAPTDEEEDEEGDEQNSGSQSQSGSSSQSSSESESSDETEEEKSCSELQNCDYNLNDRYVIETYTVDFYTLPEDLPEGVTGVCSWVESENDYYYTMLSVTETKTFYHIGYFNGMGGGNYPHVSPISGDNMYEKARKYAAANGLDAVIISCGGAGDAWRSWTWQETIDKGFALDEDKCATWGLSCGRW